MNEIICSPYLASREHSQLAALAASGIKISTATGSGSVEAPGLAIAIAAPPFPPPEGRAVAGREARLRCVLIEPRPPGSRAEQPIDPDSCTCGPAR